MTNREKAHKENPSLAKIVDFIMMHEKKIKELHVQYEEDTGDNIAFIAFANYIYFNGQDLVFNPQDN